MRAGEAARVEQQSARRLEYSMGKPSGWMDQPHGDAAIPITNAIRAPAYRTFARCADRPAHVPAFRHARQRPHGRGHTCSARPRQTLITRHCEPRFQMAVQLIPRKEEGPLSCIEWQTMDR